MINLSVPDTIDERAINKKKLTPFIIQVFLCCCFTVRMNATNLDGSRACGGSLERSRVYNLH